VRHPEGEVRGGRAALHCGDLGGPEKTGTITYALNLTQHTNGVENIRRRSCMLQLLLGNIGRPGAAASPRCVATPKRAGARPTSSCSITSWPGYLPMPLRDAHPRSVKTYLEKETPKGRLLGEPGRSSW